MLLMMMAMATMMVITMDGRNHNHGCFFIDWAAEVVAIAMAMVMVMEGWEVCHRVYKIYSLLLQRLAVLYIILK